MNTWEVVGLALHNFTKAAREEFHKLGKGVSEPWLYRQMRPAKDVNFMDFYGQFWRWVKVIYRVNPRGAMLLMEDLSTRFRALCERGKLQCLTSAHVACIRESRDVDMAIAAGKSWAEVEREALEAIAQLTWLIIVGRRHNELAAAGSGGSASVERRAA